MLEQCGKDILLAYISNDDERYDALITALLVEIDPIIEYFCRNFAWFLQFPAVSLDPTGEEPINWQIVRVALSCWIFDNPEENEFIYLLYRETCLSILLRVMLARSKGMAIDANSPPLDARDLEAEDPEKYPLDIAWMDAITSPHYVVHADSLGTTC